MRMIFKIPNDWVYRGEGNCHIVLGLPKLNKVLRIRKRDRPKTFLEWFLYFIEDYITWWYDFGANAENRDLSFHLKIMRPLLGAKYVSDAKQVKLSKIQVGKIEKQLCHIRPDFRKHKILHYGRATLFHDFTTLETDDLPIKLSNDVFSVEIKPKKGWVPFREKNFPECIFCMNQYIKLETGKISEPSCYCPRNLFSGVETEMKRCILSLIDNPQNNIRIFKNGYLFYDENENKCKIEEVMKQIFESHETVNKLLEDFSYLLFKCLTRNLESQENCEAQLFCKWDNIIQGDSLPKGCILQKILSVQMLDVEGTKYYSKFLKEKNSEWGYVKDLLKGLHPKMCVKCSLLTMSNAGKSRRNDFMFAPYLVAAVANDCSLMITLRKILGDMEESTMENIVESKYGKFVISIGVFDLYPKPMSTIRKHELRNKKLLECYKIMKKEN